ncbi:MAG: protein-glutamine glutaminase family protein [Chloroflexota bacterium]
MKLFANLLVAFSLILGQFNFPASAPFQAERATPTATATATATLPPSEDADRATPTSTNIPPSETPTATPVVTETITPVPSGTPIPPLETVPPAEEPQIVLNLTAEPGFVTPGGSNLISWSIEGISPSEHELSLEINLPKGFTPADKELKYDEATQILSITVQKESGQFELLAQETEEQAVLLAFLVEKETVLAEFALPLPLHEQFEIDERGGEIISEDGQVKINFPEGVVPDKTRISLGKPSGRNAEAYPSGRRPFEITAVSLSSAEELHEFNQPVSIEVNYESLNIPEEKLTDLYIYWYNPETGNWEALDSSIDRGTKTISTETYHFSVFDININDWQAARMPTVDSFQVSQFTGAATYSLPISVPAGPGGFQPSLSLSYSSQVVDQATLLTQSGWLGMGWSLGTSYIERDTHGTTSELSDDTFMLNLNGVTTRLLKNGSYYVSQDETFIRIQYSTSTHTWTVWDQQGNIYHFDEESTMAYLTDDYPPEAAYMTNRWLLTQVVNKFGQTINYSYTHQTKTVSKYGMTATTTTATYLDAITYANGEYKIVFQRTSRSDYPSAYDTDAVHHEYYKEKLSEIQIQRKISGVYTTIHSYVFGYANDSDADVTFPGQYFNGSSVKRVTLRSIQEFSATLGSNTLPSQPTTFHYDGLHLVSADNGYGGRVEFSYQLYYYPTAAPEYHTYVYNYGGDGEPCSLNPSSPSPWVALSGTVGCYAEESDRYVAVAGVAANPDYDNSIIRPGGAYKLSTNAQLSDPNAVLTLGLKHGNTIDAIQYAAASGNTATIVLPFTAKSAEPVVKTVGGSSYMSRFTVSFLTSTYRVSEKRIYDGVSNNYIAYTYTYEDPAVNDEAHSEHVCTLEDGENCEEYVPKYSEFRGYGTVTERGPWLMTGAGGWLYGPGAIVVTNFNQDDLYRGRPSSVTVKNSSSVTLSQTVYTYQYEELDTNYYPYKDLVRYWVDTDSVENRIFDSGGTQIAATRSVYDYNAYGLVTSVSQEQKVGSSWNPYRVTLTDYDPNTESVYLVAFPTRQRVYNGAQTSLLAETLYLYDNANILGMPAAGKLTSTLTRVNSSALTRVNFAYDGYGNVITATSYSGYASGTGTVADPFSTPSGARSEDTAYDSTYHAYPISKTLPPNASGVRARMIWVYDYNLGVPTCESALFPSTNTSRTCGAAEDTQAVYDDFGRIVKLIRPNNSTAVPTLEMTYALETVNGKLNFITTIQQLTMASEPRFTLKRYYDGIGRLLETQVGSSVNGVFTQHSSTAVSYPTPSQVVETTSFGVTTTSTSDALGRPLTVTSPAGTVSYSYNGLTTTVTEPDANGGTHTTVSVSDVWGRTQSVTPKDSGGAQIGPNIQNTYDPLDRLVTTSRGGLVTNLYYDMAGRKTSMIDPDMGAWSYTYYPSGALSTQTDARSCTITMTYDNLNRPTGKSSSGANDCVSVSAAYTYDQGTNGLGRRTSMTDPSGLTSWTYDSRGRVSSETKTIFMTPNPNVTKTTSYTYNSADMPLTMTYPDNNEVVTYDYNDQLLLNSLTSSLGDSYVSSSSYDSASRLTDRALGNGMTQKYIYPASWATQGGRLDKIVSGSGTWNGSSFTNTVQNLDYAYNAAGSVTQITDLKNNEVQTFTYDSLNRLTSAQASGVTAAAYNETYAYNATSGNLVSKGETANPETTSLAAWWSLNEASGQQRNDSHGTSHLTPSGTVGSVPGQKGNAASFSSSPSGVLTANDNAAISAGNINFTLVAHFYPTTASGTAVIVNKGYAWNSNLRDYGLLQSNSNIVFAVGNGSTNAAVSAPFSGINQWHTVIAWHDTTYDKLYIQIDNGTPVSVSYSGGAIDSTYPLVIGAHVGGSYGFNGLVDEVALYKRYLNADERSWLFNAGASRSYTEVTGNTLVYGDTNHDHAVTAHAGNTYQYDANGNQITRIIGADTYNLKYDAENRLIEVKKNSVITATFLFDGDGRRVKSVLGAEITLFFGAHYEIKNPGPTQIETKYYLAGGSRVAMRSYTVPQNSTLTYLMGDHLGSTSLAVNASTGAVIETRYKAWGEVRYTTPEVTLPTRNTFTGQYSYVSDDATDLGSSGFGLMFYQSRWYDPASGRFSQADTIIPGGVQGLDRYAYVNNSPLNYVDPSGHFGQCHDGQSGYQCRMTQTRAAQLYAKWDQEKAASASDPWKIFDDMADESDIAYSFLADGCFARAHLIAKRILERYPGIIVEKIWVTVTETGEGKGFKLEADGNQWMFHVAVLITVPNANGGTDQWVIDPSVSDKPLSIYTWTNAIGVRSSDVKYGYVDVQITAFGEAPINPKTGERYEGSGFTFGPDPTDGADAYSLQLMLYYIQCQSLGLLCLNPLPMYH